MVFRILKHFSIEALSVKYFVSIATRQFKWYKCLRTTKPTHSGLLGCVLGGCNLFLCNNCGGKNMGIFSSSQLLYGNVRVLKGFKIQHIKTIE